MNGDIQWFFNKFPKALDLYEAVEQQILDRLDDVVVKVDKTQISFKNKYGFAFVSLPTRKMKDRPAVYIIVSFGLEHEVKHPRIAYAAEPYPNRWTHHVIVSEEACVDEELLGWITEAYDFAEQKAVRRKA